MIQVVTRLLFTLSFAVFTAFSQVTTGTILGSVTDSAGAAISAATITITEVNKNTTSRTQSDDSGSFNAPFLVPGTYTIAVEKPGFKKGVQTNLLLEVDQKARADFQLTIGNVSETIEVTAAAPSCVPNPPNSAKSSAPAPSANSPSMAATSPNSCI